MLQPELGTGDLEPAPSFGTAIRAEDLLGLGKTGGAGFALVLDVDKVLSVDGLLPTRDGECPAEAGAA